MRSTIFVLFLILLAGSVTATSMVLQPAATSVLVGQQLSVDILLQEANNVYGYEAIVEFDPQRLSYVQINPGSTMSDNGKMSTFVLQPDLRKIGTIKNIVETRTGQVPGFTGSGVVRTLQFFAKTPGDAYLRIPSIVLADNLGNAIPGTIGPEVHITITGEGTMAPPQTVQQNVQQYTPQQNSGQQGGSPPTTPTAQTQQPAQPGGWVSPPGANVAPGQPARQPEQGIQQNAQLPLQQQAPPQDGTPHLVAQDTPVGEEVQKSRMNIEGPFTLFLGIALVAALGIGGYAFLKARKGDTAKQMGKNLLGMEQNHEPAIQYFRQMRMRGFGEQEIVAQLKRSGWSDDKIQQVMLRAR